jgi:hypothetical protein
MSEPTKAVGALLEPTVRPLPDRAAFELYFAASRSNRGPSKRPTFARLGDGTYADDHTQRHWWTWQQAMECAATTVEPTREDIAAQVAIDTRREAVAKAKAVGLTDADLLALGLRA